MDKFKKGQVIFFNWPNFPSKIIELYNRWNYGIPGFTHIGIITVVQGDKIMIHEAVSKGFTKSWYPKSFINKKIKEGVIEVKETKKKLIYVEDYANAYLGRGYAWFDIFGIALSFLTSWKFLKITGASKLICSEAVARILYDASNQKINFEKEYDKPYDMITPMNIFMSKELI